MSYYRYAAYGSNLHPLRLQNRVSSAVLIGTSLLPNYSLKFHKRSTKDGSGKCNISVGGSGVHVAVYNLAEADRAVLDAIEGIGHGYDKHEIEIDGFGACSIYIATPDVIDEAAHPFDWYHAYVLHGARYHGFPDDYILPLESIRTVQDENTARAAAERLQIEKMRMGFVTDTLSIRCAAHGEASLLSDLALRSKGYWGYDEEFLQACKDELTYRPDQVSDTDFDFIVAEVDGSVAGFYVLENVSAGVFELDALFVEPHYIGNGVGRTLMQHAVRSVAARNGESVLIQGDPNAQDFYLAAGATKIGERESGSVPGRYLPLFEIRLRPTRDVVAQICTR